MYDTQYSEVSHTLLPHKIELVDRLWQAVDACSNLEVALPSQLHHMVQAIADNFFDFLQTKQQYISPDHLGDVLNQARATSTFLIAVNKAMREFCFAYLTNSLLVAGLEATADFFLTMMQAYIQTNQGVLALETISKQKRASMEAMLTPPELTMLNYLVQGKTNKQIAAAMGVSERTVTNYLRRARNKLGTERKADTMAAAIKLLGL